MFPEVFLLNCFSILRLYFGYFRIRLSTFSLPWKWKYLYFLKNAVCVYYKKHAEKMNTSTKWSPTSSRKNGHCVLFSVYFFSLFDAFVNQVEVCMCVHMYCNEIMFFNLVSLLNIAYIDRLQYQYICILKAIQFSIIWINMPYSNLIRQLLMNIKVPVYYY